MSHRLTTYFIALLCALSLLTGSVMAQQEGLLIHRQEIINLMDTLPSSLTNINANGERTWKPHLQFLDNISLYDITYLSDGLKVKGYVVTPNKPGKYPCVIWNRGGVKEYGSFNVLRASGMMGRLASEGYVVIASQYRGNAGGEGQEEYGGAEIADVLNLMDVLAEIPEADTSRIGMFGGSRGGIMTYRALTLSNRIKAAATLAAPSDLYTSFKHRPSLENNMINLVPNYESNKDEEIKKRSAIYWADQFPKDVPLLIMHGNADWRVKTEHSLRLALELDEQRVPYRLIIFEGADHGLTEHRREFYQTLTTWFDTYLKQDSPLPDMNLH